MDLRVQDTLNQIAPDDDSHKMVFGCLNYGAMTLLRAYYRPKVEESRSELGKYFDNR